MHVGYGLLAKRSRTHLSSQCYQRKQEAQSQRRRCLLWLDGTSCAGSATSRRSHGQASVSFAKCRLSSCFVQRWYSRSGCGLWAESCRSAFVLVLRHRHHLSTDAVKQTKAVVLSSLDVPGTAPAINHLPLITAMCSTVLRTSSIYLYDALALVCSSREDS